MRPTSEAPGIHLVEPSGFGGVFQHTCAIGQRLRRNGQRVVLHTGHEHEAVDVDGVELCRCFWWPRRRRGSGRPARLGRRGAIIAAYLGRTLPHLHREIPDGAIVHVQGTAATSGLTLVMLWAVHGHDRRVVYSPHNTFSRGGRIDAVLGQMAYHAPHRLVVYSKSDAEILRGEGLDSHVSPLVQLVPRPSDADILRWRQEWRAGHEVSVVLLAGAIRREKRLDVLIESASSWPPGRRLAVVGEDRGDWARCAAIARARGVDIAAHVGYVTLNSFAAAIAAADVVVVPSEQASQSGVLALARELGVPSVASDVGGLAELASRTFVAADAADLNGALDAQLLGPPGSASRSAQRVMVREDPAVIAHLQAYGRLP